MTTDASLWGWGAHLYSVCVGGPWPESFRTKHINFLKLLAILWALSKFLVNADGACCTDVFGQYDWSLLFEQTEARSPNAYAVWH